jgi:hypothetical protein
MSLPTNKSDDDLLVSPKVAAKVEELLDQPMVEGYRPTLPVYTLRSQAILGWEFFQDVEMMIKCPAIAMPLNWVMAPIRMAEWNMKANSIEAAKLAGEILLWFWNGPISRVYREGNTYGWSAGEIVYEEKEGYIRPTRMIHFSARDSVPVVDPVTRVAQGIQVTGNWTGTKRLWGFRDSIPNKGFWYVHGQRFEGYFGDSQIRPAWKHWRRLAGIDGNEEITDLACYRFGTGIVKVFHPEGLYTGTTSSVPTWGVNGKVSNSDIARQISETMKAGAGIALSSEKYQNDKGGGLKWDVVVEPFTTNIEQLISQKRELETDCAKAIGVPPEVIQAAETGSGYSGRAIPLQGFLISQQDRLNDMTEQVMDQIVNPLLKWNLGPEAWACATAKPLISTYRKTAWDQDNGDGGNGQSQQQAVAGAGQAPFANGGKAQAGQPE